VTPESDRALVLACYVLHLIGAIAGLPSVIALVLNYLKRADVDSTLGSHHRWMIRSFWWTFAAVFLGALTWWVFVLGWLICAAAWLWYVYRHLRGLVRIISGEPMPG
jgi:uncharacterized membrane protein